jgi:hypothetical protein
MTITDGEKTMTLEELAKKICDSFTECDKCPAEKHCTYLHNGMCDWLRKVAEND